MELEVIPPSSMNEKFWFASAFTVGSSVLVAVIAVALTAGIEFGELTRDLSALVGSSPFRGGLSQLGIIVWAMAGGSWLVLTVLPAMDMFHRRFAVASFIVTMYLCMDDAFLLHESVAYRLPNGNSVVSILLALIIAAYVAAYFRTLRHTPICALCAFGFLGLSFGFDVIDDLVELDATSSRQWWLICEDGAKWLGIVFWLALALAQISQASARALSKPPEGLAQS